MGFWLQIGVRCRRRTRCWRLVFGVGGSSVVWIVWWGGRIRSLAIEKAALSCSQAHLTSQRRPFAEFADLRKKRKSAGLND